MRISTSQIFFQSLNGIQTLRDSVFRHEREVATGKRLSQPADDPVAAAQLLVIGERVVAIKQYDRNSNLASLRMGDQESAIASTVDALQRVRELVLRAKNPSMSTADREFIAAEIRTRLDEVLTLGNLRNASGEYIFAGTAVDTLPFTRDAAGNVVFNGNQIVRELEIAEGRTVAEGYSGAEVFMAIGNGNGTFVTDLGVANTGTGRLINDSVTNITAFQQHDFRIVFTAADTFDVIDDTTGATVLAAQAYTDGATIAFNGISVAVTGLPSTGDEFLVGPSRNQSVFETIDRAIADMDLELTSPAAEAEFTFDMDRALTDIDQVLDNLNGVRASIGARQNAIDAQRSTNEDLTVQLEALRTKLEDADIVAAISELARQTQALEAAQQAFVRVQGLSLFNFL